MNVLMISLDPSAAAKNPADFPGDLQRRLVEYGKHVSNLFVIARTPNTEHFGERMLSSNVMVFPSKSRSRLHFIVDAYRIGKKMIEREGADIVTAQDPMFTGIVGYLLKRKYRTPLNIQVHGNYLDNPDWLEEKGYNRLLNIFGKFVIKRADSIRVVSKEVEIGIKKLGIPCKKIFRIPVFVDVKKFKGGKVKKRYRGYKNVILFVGRLIKTKNVPLLLRAMTYVLKRRPKTLLSIVGDGPERKELEELVARLGIGKNVRFEGHMKYENLVPYYSSSDMLVLTSKHEGWGLVVIEALASGKPVISTNVGCAREFVVNRKTGFTIPAENHIILAKKIDYLLSNPKKRVQMGKRGQRLVMLVQDIEKNANKLTEMYRKTIRMVKE